MALVIRLRPSAVTRIGHLRSLPIHPLVASLSSGSSSWTVVMARARILHERERTPAGWRAIVHE
jgi:hypothetical protein